MTEEQYSWGAPAEAPKNGLGPRLPAGTHKVRIAAVRRTKKNGSEFVTKNGDPQAMIVFANNKGEEVVGFAALTLDPDESWMIRGILNSITPAVNWEAIRKHGVTPIKFQDEAFANKQLIGRELTITVSYSPREGKPDEPWTNLTFVKVGEVSTTPVATEVPNEEIPF